MRARRLLLVSACWTLAVPLQAALFVSSFSDHRILRFDAATGAPLGVFIAAGSGGLAAPHRVRLGPDHRLYVASANNDSILRYDATSGAFIDVFIANGGGGAVALDYPVDLIFRGAHLFVTSQLNDSVLRFDAATGAFVDVFVPAGAGGLDGPSGMVFGPEGDLFVVGRSSNRVHRYAGATGAPVTSFGAGQLAQPFGITVDADGTLYVASGDTSALARFAAATGEFLGFVPTAGSGLGFPVGVEIGPDGALYAASFGSDAVKRFALPAGMFSGDFAASSAGAALAGPNYFTFLTSAVAPTVAVAPVAADAIAGGAATFTAAFTGTPAPDVQWQVSHDGGANWTDLADGAGVSGARTPTLQFTFVSQSHAGASVRAVASNAGGAVATAAAALSVDPGNARLVNVSARAFVGLGAQVVVPGTVIQGTGTRRLLVRAVGPTLTRFNVPGVLADPLLEVRLLDNTLLATNDNWSAGPTEETAALVAAMAAVQAFPLDAGSADAALLIELPAGAYTFVVSGRNDTTGIALVEVYELP